MQTLGLSDSTPRSESRLRSLFWPTIRNRSDLDYATRQGFWICFIVGCETIVYGVVTGYALTSLLEGAFFILAGVGMRERSKVAGAAAFVAYLLGTVALQRYAGNGIGVVRIVFLALLFANVRGNWLSAKWQGSEVDELPATRLNETVADKLVDQMPALLWPKAEYLFYLLGSAELLLLVFALLAPRSR